MRYLVNSENKIRNVWWVVIFLLILTSLLIPLIVIADRLSFNITIAHQAIIILIASIICQLLRRKSISDLIGYINSLWLKDLFLGFMIGATLMILPALLLSIFGYIHWEANSFPFSATWTGISTLLFAAIAEELLFRGMLFQRLIDAFGNWPAQLIVAGLFLLTHINNPNMTGILKYLACINIFIASLMFGIAYIKTKSLALPLGLHFMANFIQGTVLGFGVSGDKEPSLFTPVFDKAPIWLSGGDFGIEASVPGLFFVTAITICLFFWKPKLYTPDR